MARKASKAPVRKSAGKPAAAPTRAPTIATDAYKILESARLYWRVGDWAALGRLTQHVELPKAGLDEAQAELALYTLHGAFMTADLDRGRSLARALATLPGQRERVIRTLVSGSFASLARARFITGQHQRALAAVRASVEMRDDLVDLEALVRLRIEAERRYLAEEAGLRVRDPMAGRKLFIDCGGHDGCSALMFLLNNPDHDCVSFEPNPSFWEHYDGLPTTLVKSAVYTYDGEVELIIDPLDGDGSTLVEGKQVEFHGTLSNAECPRINVPCVDLSKFVDEKSNQYERITLKLDIEGAEYDILEKMLADGTLRHVDKLYCEFHGHKMDLPAERHDRIYEAVTKIVDVSPWDAIALSFSSDIKGSRRKKLRSFLVDNISRHRTL
jgi:FkbM family methyltransferase